MQWKVILELQGSINWGTTPSLFWEGLFPSIILCLNLLQTNWIAEINSDLQQLTVGRFPLMRVKAIWTLFMSQSLDFKMIFMHEKQKLQHMLQRRLEKVLLLLKKN